MTKAAGRVLAESRSATGKALDVGGVVALVVVVALLWRAIAPLNPSDLLVYFEAVRRLAADDVYRHLYPIWPFTYPPSALVILTFLAAPWALARVLMFALSIAGVVATVALTIRSSAPPRAVWRSPGAIALASSVAVVSVPVVLGTALGQVAAIVMGLSAAATLGPWSRGSGVWLGTAIAVKLTPIVFAAYWWITGRRRPTLVAVATLVGWSALAALVMPSSSRWYFFEAGMVETDRAYVAGSSNVSNQAINGFVARLGLDLPGGRLLVLLLGVMALGAGLAVAARAHRAGWEAVAVGLVGIWSGVAVPVAFVHAFGWWVPLGLAIGLSGGRRTDWTVAVLTCLVPYLIIVGPRWDAQGVGVLQHLWASSYGVLAIALTVWLWLRTRRVTGSLPGP